MCMLYVALMSFLTLLALNHVFPKQFIKILSDNKCSSKIKTHYSKQLLKT